MPIYVTLRIILQALIIYYYNSNAVLCVTSTNYDEFRFNKNEFQNHLIQSETEFYAYNHSCNIPPHKLNFYTHTQLNKLNAHNTYYKYKNPSCYSNSSKIQIHNDSINVFHSFHKKYSTDKQTSPFIQLGVHEILSKQIISFGGGKRYMPNNIYTIGYNIFYHCPISNYSYDNQPYSINLGVEYWLYNTLFSLSNYYNLNHLFSFGKSLQKYDMCNLKNSYQICIQSKFPYFSKITGQAKLEQFFYTKQYKKLFNKNNNNYCLSLNLNYQPIPILSFNINNIFTNKKYHSIYQIVINYQFDIPIKKQINDINKQKKSISTNHLDTIIQPFIPTVTRYKHNIVPNNNPDYNVITQSSQHIQDIIGYPGEIKIVKIKNNNNKTITWDLQLLQNKGGHILLISNDIYAIYLPNHPITKEDNVFISYDNNISHNTLNHTKQKIRILVNKSSQKQPLTTPQDNYIIDNNDNSSINVTKENTINNTLSSDEEYCHQKNNTLTLDTTTQYNINYITTTTTNTHNITSKNDFVFPTPPPLPSISTVPETESLSFIETSTPNNTLPLSCLIPNEKYDQTYSPNNENEKKHSTSDECLQTTPTNQNDDLSHRLSKHKKYKFSSVGTTEHINKLEHVIEERKKHKSLSNIEQMFTKLQIAQSSLSIDEDYTTDDSNDSFSSNKN